jgi:hypothetical protein
LPVSSSEGSEDLKHVKLSMMNCSVVFGAGASVESITTAFESSVVLVTDVPRDTSQDALFGLMEQFGHVKSFQRDLQAKTVRVDFLTAREAASAVEGLTDRVLDGSNLSARFELGAIHSSSATLRSTKVKASWFAPSTLVYAHYDTISRARNQAESLDAQMFGGTTIRAQFQTPTYRQRESFTVVLKGVPAASSPRVLGRLQKFAGTSSVTIGKPTYREQIGITAVRTLLERFGSVDSFEVMPHTGKKITTWVQFASTDATVKAIQEVHAQPQASIGRSPLWLEQFHSFKYTLPRAQFQAVKDDIDRFSATLDVQCKLRYYDKDAEGVEVDPVCMRLHSSDARTLGKAKATLEQLLLGERLEEDDGTAVWHDFFQAQEGTAFIDDLNHRSAAFVERNTRSRYMRLHGPGAARAVARHFLLAKVRELRAQQHVIPLERVSMRNWFLGGFKAMQAEFGEHTVVFNIVRRTLTVHGDDETVAAVRRRAAQIMAEGAAAPYATVAYGRSEESCPVCFCETTDGVTLPCTHVYDRDCLRMLMQSACSAADFKTVACVAETDDKHACSAKVPFASIRALLAPEEEQRLLEASLRAHVDSHPDDFHCCPSPDCPTVYRPARAGTTLRCPSCLERICAHCHVEYHGTVSESRQLPATVADRHAWPLFASAASNRA